MSDRGRGIQNNILADFFYYLKIKFVKQKFVIFC